MLQVMALTIEWFLQQDVLALNMILTGVFVFFLLFVVSAPYGRYSARGWGPLINGKVAWFVQEIGSFAVPVIWLAFFASPAQLERVSIPANAILMAAFLVHYFYRDLIYPWRLRSPKPTPLAVLLSATVFCVYNGFMQTRYFLNAAPMRLSSHRSPRFIAGMSAWLAGWLINLHADAHLISLRKRTGREGGSKEKSTYHIPRAGMFKYVSAANYFGECIEWLGWAVAAWSLPAAAFSFFTLANLLPRGYTHHLWYLDYFKEKYPKERRVIIPFLW